MQCTDPHVCQSEDVCTSQLRDDSSVGDEDIFMNYQLSQFYCPQFPGPSSSPSVFRQPDHHSFSRSPTPSTASMFSHPSSYSEVIAYILLSPDPISQGGYKWVVCKLCNVFPQQCMHSICLNSIRLCNSDYRCSGNEACFYLPIAIHCDTKRCWYCTGSHRPGVKPGIPPGIPEASPFVAMTYFYKATSNPTPSSAQVLPKRAFCRSTYSKTEASVNYVLIVCSYVVV